MGVETFGWNWAQLKLFLSELCDMDALIQVILRNYRQSATQKPQPSFGSVSQEASILTLHSVQKHSGSRPLTVSHEDLGESRVDLKQAGIIHLDGPWCGNRIPTHCSPFHMKVSQKSLWLLSHKELFTKVAGSLNRDCHVCISVEQRLHSGRATDRQAGRQVSKQELTI